MQKISVRNVDLENLFTWVAAAEGDRVYFVSKDIESAAQSFMDWQFFGIGDENRVKVKKSASTIIVNDNDICEYHFTNVIPPDDVNSDSVVFLVEGDCSMANDRSAIISAI